MIRLSVDISEPGPTVVIKAIYGQRIMVQRFLLTFSHSETHALRATIRSNAAAIAGPFFATDGAVWEYERGESTHYRVQPNQDFVIDLEDGLSCAGMIEYEFGSW